MRPIRFRHIFAVRLMVMTIAVIGLLFTGGTGHLSHAQTVITPDPDSKIWIEGRSNVNQFTCDARGYDGRAVIRSEAVEDLSDLPEEDVRLELKIPVRSFECGRNRMNRDLYEALKSDEYIDITFEYTEAKTLSTGESGNGAIELEVIGLLTVAGSTREISFAADGFLLEDNRMRATGKITIRMTDYNVEPPKGLFGLVQAENELTVHFDLYASPQNNAETLLSNPWNP